VCVISCLVCEAICLSWSGKRVMPVLWDGSAVLTATLLAMSLPPFLPAWMAVLGSVCAIVLAKQVFGGLGCNLFNPAMVGRTILLVSFPVQMTQWIDPHAAQHGMTFLQALAISFQGVPIPDALTSASLLGHVKTEVGRGIELMEALRPYVNDSALTGARAGSVGEGASLLVLAGGLFLVAKRIIGLRIPIGFMLGVAIPALIAHHFAPQSFLSAGEHLISGGVLLGAFFIATDYVTSPSSPMGQWIFALGGGLLTWLIRTWGGYPEGVGFAILLMNSVAPLLDLWIRPRIFGRSITGKSLEARRVEEALR
jgi:Na+-translocating ferredoxin:NAD+ oxidoreductase subunit D